MATRFTLLALLALLFCLHIGGVRSDDLESELDDKKDQKKADNDSSIADAEDKQQLGIRMRNFVRRLRDLMRRGLFQNSLVRGAFQCFQTMVGCTLDSVAPLGASGGGSSSSSSSSNQGTFNCVRNMAECTRETANSSPLATLLAPPPSGSSSSG